MNRAALVVCAAVLDAIAGDPPTLPHPVRFIGMSVTALEARARARIGDEVVAGACVTVAVVAAAALAGGIVARAPFLVRVAAAASCLACGSLFDHVAAVRDALERGDLEHARVTLARIVGRDTKDLDESEVARGAIESLAESLCDGVVAPLLALTCLGLSGAFAYKAINTLDSMIGHIEPPYTRFGRCAARLDDAANVVPARLTMLLIASGSAVCGRGVRGSLETALRDGARHRSPNAGWSEAAMAGALGVRLGGPSSYDGVRHDAAAIGAAFRAPRAADVRDAMEVAFAAATIAYAGAVALGALLR